MWGFSSWATDWIKDILNLRHILKSCLTLKIYGVSFYCLFTTADIQIICLHSFLFLINPLRLWTTALWYLRTINKAARWIEGHQTTPLCGTSRCSCWRITIKFAESIVSKPLWGCCKTEKWECGIMRVWVRVGNVVVVSESKTITKTAAVVREMYEKPKYTPGQEKPSQNHPWNLKHSRVIPDKTNSMPSEQMQHYLQDTGIFNRCPFPKQQNVPQVSITDGALHFMKKLTALYLMPPLYCQALFVSVNLFRSQRQSASRCWRPDHCHASTGDNNSGTETFY